MSQAIDTIILLYASDTSSPFHKKAKEFINSLLTGPELLYLAWPVIMGYLRIATHPSVFDEPLSPEEAMENIETLLELPHVRLLSEQDGFWLAYRKAAENTVVTGNLVPDAHLAALLLQHGVKTISTHDRDYQRFPFINTRDPFPPPTLVKIIRFRFKTVRTIGMIISKELPLHMLEEPGKQKAPAYKMHYRFHTWSMIDGLLFRGELTRVLIGQAVISSEAYGTRTSFPASPLSHASWTASGRMTGILLWIVERNSFGSQVMIVQVRSQSSDPGFFQPSHRPANTKGSPDLRPIEYGCFKFPARCHSKKESTGIKHRRFFNADRYDGAVSTDSTLALIVL
jgi:uncharacterized protein